MILSQRLLARGYNVIPFFGYPGEAVLRKFAFDRDGRPALAAGEQGGIGPRLNDSRFRLTRVVDLQCTVCVWPV